MFCGENNTLWSRVEDYGRGRCTKTEKVHRIPTYLPIYLPIRMPIADSYHTGRYGTTLGAFAHLSLNGHLCCETGA